MNNGCGLKIGPPLVEACELLMMGRVQVQLYANSVFTANTRYVFTHKHLYHNKPFPGCQLNF